VIHISSMDSMMYRQLEFRINAPLPTRWLLTPSYNSEQFCIQSQHGVPESSIKPSLGYIDRTKQPGPVLTDSRTTGSLYRIGMQKVLVILMCYFYNEIERLLILQTHHVRKHKIEFCFQNKIPHS